MTDATDTTDTTGRSIQHATFAIERTFEATPAQVFAAWADPAAKARWFVGPGDWTLLRREQDFRVGGTEHVSGGLPDFTTRFDAYYHDIVPDHRIVYSYRMQLNGAPISVSLATVELYPAGDGDLGGEGGGDGTRTRLVLTEQGAFFGGYADEGRREQGTGWLLDQIDAWLNDVRHSLVQPM